MSQEIRVIVVDDHPIYRDGLASILESEPPFRVVGQAETVRQAMDLLDQQPCDLLITDLHLAQESGLSVIEQSLQRQPDLPIVVLSINDRAETAEEAIAAGARGYMVKTVARQELLRGLRSVYDGGTFLHTTSIPLSGLESRVLQLVAAGQENQAIGTALHVSVQTVKAHLRSLFAKLEVSDRQALIAEATSRGLVLPPES